MNEFGRVPVCGLVSGYNATALPEGPNRVPALMGAVLTKSLTLRGFIQREFADQMPQFRREMSQWIADGQVKYREDITQGLDNTVDAFIGMLRGENFGKVVIEVAQ